MGAFNLPKQQQNFWLTVFVLFCAASLSAAYPELFVTNEHANGCTAHLTRPFGGHQTPVLDTAITFTLSKKGSTAPVTTVCPGVPYDVLVDYGGKRRRTFITASAGKFATPGSLPADATCPNRAASGGGSTTYTNTLTVPCDAKGPKLLLNVTSAGGGSDSFHQASTSYTLNPVSQCPDSTCPGAAAATAAAAGPAPAAAKPAVPAALPATRAAAAAPAAAAAAVRAGGSTGCGSSAYQYACAVNARDGAMLHYTLSDSSTPPENACTASAAGSSAQQQQQQYLHMLLESPAQGYNGVGFPQTAEKMYPADAVIGYVDPATGQPVVSAYHLTDYSPIKSAQNSNGTGWATNLGAAKPSGANGPTLLCFSRPVDAPGAAVAKKLDTSDLNLNWVGHSSTDFDTHTLKNSLALNIAEGTVTSSGGSSKLAMQLAHGALMLLAFSVFMPLGALMARHKWLMGDKAKGGIRPGWFHIHRAVQCLSVLLALAGFILALVAFNIPWSNMTPQSTPHKLYNPHRVLGVIVIALSLLQVVFGIARPGLTHKRRQNWGKGHTIMGWLAVTAGIAVCFMGAVMMHDLAGAPYINWLLPICLFVGLALIGGVVAEVQKSKLQRHGRYCPKTHSFDPPGLGSVRSSGTATPDVQVSPTSLAADKAGSTAAL